MAKVKLKEGHSFTGEGILNIDTDTGNVSLEVEDIGVKNLATLLDKFNGALVKISVSWSTEVE